MANKQPYEFLHVKVKDTVGLKKTNNIFFRVHYGKITKVTKKGKATDVGATDEMVFSLDGKPDKTLIFEVLYQGLMKKKVIGQAQVNMKEQDLSLGESKSLWVKLLSKHLNADMGRGEIQISIEYMEDEMLSPRRTLAPSLKEVDKLMGSAVFTVDYSHVVPAYDKSLDPSTTVDTIRLNRAKSVVNKDTLNDCRLKSCHCEVGVIVLTFVPTKKAKKRYGWKLYLPYSLPLTDDAFNEWKKEGESYVTLSQGPDVRLELFLEEGEGNHDEYKLSPAHRVSVRAKIVKEEEGGEDETPLRVMELSVHARALSIPRLCSNRIMLASRINMNQMEKVENKDSLSDFERKLDFPAHDLIKAALHKDHEKLKECLDRFDDVNAQDDEGNTALHQAVTMADKEAIEMLVERGAEPRLKNKYDESPVDLADKFHPDFLSLLRRFQ